MEALQTYSIFQRYVVTISKTSTGVSTS